MDLAMLMEDIPVQRWVGARSGHIVSVCYDSRACLPGSLFVAVPGLLADGHAYIPDAIRNGARVIVHERPLPTTPDAQWIQVADSRRVLGKLGRNFYRHPSSRLCLVGVVGTNGKTTVTYLLESILMAAGFSVGVVGTVNYRFKQKVLAPPHTTPESLEMQRVLREMADDGVSHVVAEISSHAVDLRRVDDCDFDLGVFTNLSQDHLDYHKTMENYFAAKKRFFQEVLPASRKNVSCRMVVNADDPWGQRLLREVRLPHLSFGIDASCDLSVRKVRLAIQGTQAEIGSAGRRFKIASPLIGRYNLYNILAATAAALSLGISTDKIRAGIEHVGQIPGRMEKVSSPDQPAVFVDYAHTDDALRRVLQNLAIFKQGRLITLFGCGGDRDRGKRPLMAQAAAELSDLVIITSDNPRTEDPLEIIRQVESGFPGTTMMKVPPEGLKAGDCGRCYTVIPDRGAAIDAAIACAGSRDLVVIAGKGHEDYQILGNRRIPFDDRRHAQAALEKRFKQRNP
ncbi:MAG: UDP-N-acetylmuramoyl-L-alanyl-D-glutamate--2,6-diaminopimelate ligase [Pseudomonadota bacterium]